MKNYTEINHINPKELVVHTELIRIYGDAEERTDLKIDIAANGIMVPLVVSTRHSINTIVSGACRLRVAQALGIEVVPVLCYKFPSQEAEKHFILSANRNRPKTKYQQLLEGKEWELIEKQTAALRRREGLSQRWKNKDAEKASEIDEVDTTHGHYPPTLLPDYRSETQVPLQSKKKLRVTDKVGSRIGMSGKSYQRARPIIEKCEQLRSLGKDSQASALADYLELAGIVPASELLKSPFLSQVLSLVASGEAKSIKEALVLVGRIQKVSAVVEGAIFFFPNKMLRKPTYYHFGRVVKIANMTATVCFRDSIDWNLYEHQYKRDELLSLTCSPEELSQQQLRERMTYLLSHPCATPTDRHILNWLLCAVTSIPDEVDYLQIIEWRVSGASNKKSIVA